MYYVYILQSLKDHEWYIGFTENIEQRVMEHNSGKNVSTKNRVPFKLIYYEAYLNKLDTLGREGFLKSGSGHRFIKKQLRNFIEDRLV